MTENELAEQQPGEPPRWYRPVPILCECANRHGLSDVHALWLAWQAHLRENHRLECVTFDTLYAIYQSTFIGANGLPLSRKSLQRLLEAGRGTHWSFSKFNRRNAMLWKIASRHRVGGYFGLAYVNEIHDAPLSELRGSNAHRHRMMLKWSLVRTTTHPRSQDTIAAQNDVSKRCLQDAVRYLKELGQLTVQENEVDIYRTDLDKRRTKQKETIEQKRRRARETCRLYNRMEARPFWVRSCGGDEYAVMTRTCNEYFVAKSSRLRHVPKCTVKRLRENLWSSASSRGVEHAGNPSPFVGSRGGGDRNFEARFRQGAHCDDNPLAPKFNATRIDARRTGRRLLRVAWLWGEDRHREAWAKHTFAEGR